VLGVAVGPAVICGGALFTGTVTSPVVFPALLVTVILSTYDPVWPNVTVLELALGDANVTAPGPDTFDQA
jgi:hypothetical protein